MAEEVGAAAGKAVGTAALKSFINPSADILKAIPQGIIELSLRGAAAVRIRLSLAVHTPFTYVHISDSVCGSG